MAKKKSSSQAWLQEHRNDPYVQRAQRDGYRSRACYKLLELQDKDKLIRPGMTVVDLGSAPRGLVAGGGGAGWAQWPGNRLGYPLHGRPGRGRIYSRRLYRGAGF